MAGKVVHPERKSGSKFGGVPFRVKVSRFFRAFESFRPHAAVGLGVVFFVLAALNHVPFSIGLPIGALGAILGYAFGKYVAALATGVLIAICTVWLSNRAFPFLQGISQFFDGK